MPRRPGAARLLPDGILRFIYYPRRCVPLRLGVDEIAEARQALRQSGKQKNGKHGKGSRGNRAAFPAPRETPAMRAVRPASPTESHSVRSFAIRHVEHGLSAQPAATAVAAAQTAHDRAARLRIIDDRMPARTLHECVP